MQKASQNLANFGEKSVEMAASGSVQSALLGPVGRVGLVGQVREPTDPTYPPYLTHLTFYD